MSQRKIGVLLSYGTQAVNILAGLLYTPVMLRLLGQSEFGLYTLVNSVISYLGLLSLGFGSSYIRYYARYEREKDEEGIAGLNGLFILVFSVIASAALVCGWIMVQNAEALFGSGLTGSEIVKAQYLMRIMMFTMAISLLSTVFNCILSAHEQFFFQQLLAFLQSLLNPFLTLPLLLLGFGSVSIVVTALVLTAARLILGAVYCIRRLHVRFSFHRIPGCLLTEIGAFTFFIFLNQIVDQLNWSVDKFLLGRFSGTGAVAVYGVGSQLHSMYMNFSIAVSAMFVPQVNKLVACGASGDTLTAVFTKVGRIQFMILMLLLSGFVFFGRPFIRMWGGPEYGQAYAVALLLMGPVTIPLIQNIGIEIQRAMNKHQTRSVVYACIALANILISIPLIRYFGVIGAAVGTAVSLFLGNILFMNWYYHYRLHLNMLYFWKQIGRFLPALVLPAALGLVMKKYFPIQGWTTFLLAAFLYTVVYCLSMYALGMNQYERSLLKGSVKKLRGAN